MTEISQSLATISLEVRKWAAQKLAEDKDYIEQRAKFGPEPVRSIARLVIEAGQEKNQHFNGKLEGNL